ncbi:MAG: sulfurtransferase [Leptolyngbyaceae cyanobacterium]
MQTVAFHKLTFLLVALFCLQILACSRGKGPPASQPDSSSSNQQNAVLGVTQPGASIAPDFLIAPSSLEQRWIVSATEALELIDQGATLLDARGQGLIKQKLPGAIAVNWRDFSPRAAAVRGRLLEDDAQLTQRLQALGISQNIPVVVLGDPPRGWGEDGRIVWMLRTLGHQQAVLVDGGLRALVEEAGDTHSLSDTSTAHQPGDFVVRRDPTWSIQRDAVRSQIGSDNLVIIDTREPREFAGKTPYGEQRGGHIPGAVNLYFKDLWGEDGRLLSRQEVNVKLQALGITPDTEVIVYCTGGIRSGWVAAVLVTWGFSTQNYAGSMWEWSAAPAEQYPLAKVAP